jgi:hypothetical protein
MQKLMKPGGGSRCGTPVGIGVVLSGNGAGCAGIIVFRDRASDPPGTAWQAPSKTDNPASRIKLVDRPHTLRASNLGAQESYTDRI